jgi:hypothetical protein
MIRGIISRRQRAGVLKARSAGCQNNKPSGKAMISWFRFLQNFPFGIFLGFIAAMGLFWFLGADLSEDLTRYGTYILTALASLLASAVAFATVIWNGEKQREQRLFASRASLPMALSSLIDLSKRGIDYSLRDNAFLNNPSNAREVEKSLLIPSEIIGILKDCIENESDLDTQLWFARLLSSHQVYYARLTGLISDRYVRANDHYRVQHASEWCMFHALVEHLFDYARKGTKPEKHLGEDRVDIPMYDKPDSLFYSGIMEYNQILIQHLEREIVDGSI